MGVRFSEDWLQQHKNRATGWKNGRAGKGTGTTLAVTNITKAVKAVKAAVSPHAKALLRLAKDPSLEKGNVEHYSQVRYFRMLEVEHPEVYEITHATPNGVTAQKGRRDDDSRRPEARLSGYLR